MNYIYALFDPIIDEPRYVGQSIKPLDRYRSHLSLRQTPPRMRQWITHLQQRHGKAPDLVILDECPSESQADAAERMWITTFRTEGFRLFNLLPGGKRYERYISCVSNWTHPRRAPAGVLVL